MATLGRLPRRDGQECPSYIGIFEPAARLILRAAQTESFRAVEYIGTARPKAAEQWHDFFSRSQAPTRRTDVTRIPRPRSGAVRPEVFRMVTEGSTRPTDAASDFGYSDSALANFMGDSAMIAPREMVVRDALKLPEEERVRVVQDLLDSLSPEASDKLDANWAEELDRRFAAWEADPAAGVPWSELKSQR